MKCGAGAGEAAECYVRNEIAARRIACALHEFQGFTVAVISSSCREFFRLGQKIIQRFATFLAHHVGGPALCSLPHRESLADHRLTAWGQVQPAAAPSSRRVHDDVTESQKAFQVS